METRHEARLKKIALAYMPVVALGAIASLYYDVGAEPGAEAREDVLFRGTPLVPPLFLPVLLLAASRLTPRRDIYGVVSTAATGLVGVAFVAGSTLNLPNDLAAARAAGSPLWATWLLAAIHLPLGIALAGFSFASLRARRRLPPTDHHRVNSIL